jgi:hypothetical protein
VFVCGVELFLAQVVVDPVCLHVMISYRMEE